MKLVITKFDCTNVNQLKGAFIITDFLELKVSFKSLIFLLTVTFYFQKI